MRGVRVFALLLMIAGAIALASSQTNPTPGAQPSGKTAEQQFKNIQVLKGVPADEVIPAMQYFTAALGVQCGFCHVVQPGVGLQPEKDDKDEKKTARQMMTMTRSINDANFKGNLEVGCATCHAGKSNPTALPPMGEQHQAGNRQGPPPAQPGNAAQGNAAQAGQPKPQLPTVQQILDNYENAIGGKTAIQKLTTRVSTGAVTLPQGNVQFEVDQKAPNMALTSLTFNNGRNQTEGTNGTAAWSKTDQGVRDMSGYPLRTVMVQTKFDRDLMPGASDSNTRVVGTDTIDGHECYVVRGTTPDPAYSERLYFDKQTGLLVRRTLIQRTLFGPIPETFDYSDFRDVQGVKVPFTIKRSRPDNAMTIKYDKIEFNVPIDDSKFARPAGPATPGH